MMATTRVDVTCPKCKRIIAVPFGARGWTCRRCDTSFDIPFLPWLKGLVLRWLDWLIDALVLIPPVLSVVFAIYLSYAMYAYFAARPTIGANDLTGLQIIDTEQFACGQENQLTWTNDAEDIYVKQVQIWMGMYEGSRADFGVWLQRSGRESTLLHSNWDHYADPVGPDHYIDKDYGGNYISVRPGESLSLHYSCHDTGSTEMPGVGHATVTIWFVR